MIGLVDLSFCTSKVISEIVFKMTYNVSSRTLNLTLSIYRSVNRSINLPPADPATQGVHGHRGPKCSALSFFEHVTFYCFAQYNTNSLHSLLVVLDR